MNVYNMMAETHKAPSYQVIDKPHPQPTAQFPFGAYLFALLSIVLATVVGSVIRSIIPLNPANLVMVYLLAVVVTALRSGFGPAVMVSVVSVFAFNFFFVPPELTFHVAEAQYLLTFTALLITGVVISNLAARARQQTETALRRQQQTAHLYSFSRDLLATVDAEEMMQTVINHVKQMLQCEVCLFIAQNGTLGEPLTSDNCGVSPSEQTVARRVFKGQVVDKDVSPIMQYIPLKTAQTTIGVLGLQLDKPLSPDKQRLVEAFAVPTALAFEAAQLAEQAKQAELLREKEKLQTILLNSISHDLRTPLVSITGTLGSLKDDTGQIAPAARQDLLEGAYEEATRLNRLVGNLLEMSRLQAGSLRLKRELYDVHEIISVARGQMREIFKKHKVHIEIDANVPLVSVDLVLFALVIVNLLDNASKYSEPDSPIDLHVSHTDSIVQIEVADRGVGIPPEQLPYIFDHFFRATTAQGRSGSGLGLPICQGIVELHHGTIEAKNREGDGTRFIVRIPVDAD